MPIDSGAYAALTLEGAAAGIAANAFTPADLLRAALERIERFDPVCNAMITVDREGAGRAAEAPPPEGVSLLAGVPLAVKDNIMTRGLRSTCGSRILDDFIPPYDAGVVERLRAAGSVVVGKANMDEFAMGSTGENSAYGPARNPWNPRLATGGSSSGSAAVVAYGGVPAALGSDTGGSIRQPAAFCGLVGMKPTYGRVSRWGLGALASSLDQIGPLTRTVRDNALLYDAIAGHDERDSTSANRPLLPCLPAVEDGVKGLRIGYDPSLFDKEGMAKPQSDGVRRAIGILRDEGAVVAETTLPLIDYGVAAYYIICSCEASANLTRYDGVRYGVRRGAADLWETLSATRGSGFGDEVKRRIMMGAYALSSGYYDAYYLKAAKVRRLLAEAYRKAWNAVDALLLPVTPRSPPPVGREATALENYLGDVFTLPANLAGIPALSFPASEADGLPVGVQAMGAHFREDVLYRIARAVEKSVKLADPPWTRPNPEGGR